VLLLPGIAPSHRQDHSLLQPSSYDYYLLPVLVFRTSAVMFVKCKLSVFEIYFTESEIQVAPDKLTEILIVFNYNIRLC
jgi:hypothetical protein